MMTATPEAQQQIVGRFAPSPTGPLHLGSLVTALGSYLMAKRCGGQWLLRMEDLDTARIVPGMADDIMRTLEMLGLCWDGEIIWQSRRTLAYADAFERLAATGDIYPCGCSRAEIARSSTAPHDGEEGPPYPGFCRNGLRENGQARAFRFRVAQRTVIFDDMFQGLCTMIPANTCGDFVVKRSDGPYAYHLAVVVDDAYSGVNQVVRGADLLSSTPRQILLQEHLDIRRPAYGHLPLVTNPDGSKLSKRANAVSLSAGTNLLREGGRMLLAALIFLGQSPPADIYHVSSADVLAWAAENFDPFTVFRQPAPFPDISELPYVTGATSG